MLKNAQGQPIPKVDIMKPKKNEIETVDEGTLVFNTPAIKLKRPNRDTVVFDFEKSMGFRPKRIVVKLSTRTNNAFIIGVIDDDRQSKYAKEIDAKK